MRQVDIAIIGGGAAGMAAAITAATRAPEKRILILEKNDRPGRKLRATGNGRCNLTNLNHAAYHGDAPEFANDALNRFDAAATLDWFRSMGLYTVAEPSGRVYPYSDQANSVVDVLRFALEKPNIEVRTGFEVTKIRKGFIVENGEESLAFDRLIIACGGLAGTKLGGSMAGYQLLRSMGHRMTRLRPALVQLKCGWNGVAALKGVRANCRARILRDGIVHAESVGEIQFTEYGLSGPVIFEVSRDACQGRGDWSCQLDFLPEYEGLKEELQRRRQTALPVEELLTGILHNRLGRVLTKAAGITGGRAIASLSDGEIEQVCQTAHAFDIRLTEPLGMDSAQVTAGGILTEEFVSSTMESCLVPGLYACGEVLDIDGDCGGYNLQWAWSSGRCAGLAAGKE